MLRDEALQAQADAERKLARCEKQLREATDQLRSAQEVCCTALNPKSHRVHPLQVQGRGSSGSPALSRTGSSCCAQKL